MNEIINKSLLAGAEKFKEAGDLRYICQNELDKTCFHDMSKLAFMRF